MTNSLEILNKNKQNKNLTSVFAGFRKEIQKSKEKLNKELDKLNHLKEKISNGIFYLRLQPKINALR